ncbi:SodC Cu/Zn superoxide dismutase [Burkholderiaceae bacterium]|jgi:Cu-Zn family superoxide dismutase
MKNTWMAVLPSLLALTFTASAQASNQAMAVLQDRAGQVVGEVRFTDGPHGILLHVSAKGLPAGPKGMHVHQVGTCADGDKGFVASGAHLNPSAKKHGLMNPEGPDAGDLPNLMVHADGSVEVELFTMLASLSGQGGRPALLDDNGAAIVIHENRDDHLAQPIGGAGARRYCGVVKPVQ